MATFKIKKQDTLPVFAVTFQYANGSAINLTNGSVFMYLGSINNYSPIFSGACTITNETTGQAEYRWTGSPDSYNVGTFLAEFKAIWTGSELTLPSDHSLRVQVFEDYE